MGKTKTAPAQVSATEGAAPNMDPPAIDQRGEIKLNLSGIDFVLRPSHEAIEAFEGLTDRGILELARAAIAGALKTVEIAQIVTECVKAWGREVQNTSAAGATTAKMKALIVESEGGVYAVQQQLGRMLPVAATGGYTAKGELKPATTTV